MWHCGISYQELALRWYVKCGIKSSLLECFLHFSTTRTMPRNHDLQTIDNLRFPWHASMKKSLGIFPICRACFGDLIADIQCLKGKLILSIKPWHCYVQIQLLVCISPHRMTHSRYKLVTANWLFNWVPHVRLWLAITIKTGDIMQNCGLLVDTDHWCKQPE